MNFVKSNGSSLCLIIEMSFPNEIVYDVVGIAILRDEKIVLLLQSR